MQHPWAWIAKPLGFEEEERVLALLAQFLAALRKAGDYCGHLQTTAGITISRTVAGLSQALAPLSQLPDSEGALLPELLTLCQPPANRQALSEFVESVESYRRGIESISASTGGATSLLDAPVAAALSAALESPRPWGLDGHTVAELKDLRKVCEETAKLVGQAQASFQVLLGIVGCDAPARLSSAAFLLATVRIAEAAPYERLHLRLPSFEDEHAKSRLRAASKEAAALKGAEAAIGGQFDLSLAGGMYTPAQLLESAASIDESSLWQRLFGGDYRKAVVIYRRIALDKTKCARAQMSSSLKAVAEYKQRRTLFDGNASHREMLGPHFAGVASPWEDLDLLLTWYEQVFVLLPEHQGSSEPFRRLVFTARSERLKAIKADAASAQDHRQALEQIVGHMTDFAHRVPSQRLLAASGTFADVLACLQKLTHELETALQAVGHAGIRDNVALRNIPGILAAAAQCRSAKGAVEGASALPALLGSAYRGVNTDIGPIRCTLRVAESVTAGSLPEKTVSWLLSPDYEQHKHELSTWLRGAHDCGADIETACKGLAEISGSGFWTDNASSSLGALQALAQSASAQQQELPRWNHFVRLRLESAEKGFERLTTLADTRVLEPSELVAAFHFVFYNTLARSAFTEYAQLSQVTGVTQELLRKQFAEADREAIRLYSERVACQVDQRPVPYGNQSGPVRTWTEMALVMNEINKQKRHIPIRQLIQRAANALVALKPCFMMGPLSVAQYLAPGQLRFDLIVMDEASQLKPEDAIGALVRGGQVVIVGDPKQLPPTSFFQRVTLDSEEETPDDTRTAVEEGESILDVASTLFQPVRRLRWHYRSRHHSLIAFSNTEFYQRDLIIFPSAYHDDPSLGVKHQFVEGGVFENSRNPREAAVVVEAVLEHMRRHAGESLGVVTLNFEQRELVEELLDRRLRDDPAAIAFQERMKGGQETLFVKNLENVQGDERDVIFISTTYGPDVRGNQFQRFGPINGASGHRRLNVLFTRAKKRTVVFSSLDPDRIQTTPNSPWGVRALKQYLIYARTGILQQAEEEGEQESNDFERSVGSVLKEKGYDIAAQVGVAGFFIDLGVKHPAKPGAFLLGVECDGAGYHSGRSARDRDRLRQEILENLGWKIHRIWSTDWFKNRESEVKRLLGRIEEILQSDPAYVKEQARASRAETLRRRLVMMRDEEIGPAFPDTPEDKCLLNPALLEEFMQKRPKTKDDWFRKIPQELRGNIASKQVGQYLDRVLQIIAEHS